MSRAVTGTLPLAFILAMAAEASAASTPIPDQNQFLEPGMLAGLVQRAIGLEAGGVDPEHSGDRRLPGDKRAQFFPNFPNFPNFFNCFTGMWRNC